VENLPGGGFLCEDGVASAPDADAVYRLAPNPNVLRGFFTARRIQALALLFCILALPLGTLAAPLLQKSLGCCATMCTMRHAPAEPAPAPMCHHTQQKEKSRSAVDCCMKGVCASHDTAAVAPLLPRVILQDAVSVPVLFVSRTPASSVTLAFPPGFSLTPDQPPRA